MPLSAHVTPRIVVPLLDDNNVAVRGLNLDDFTALMPEHFDSITKIADLYSRHQTSVFSGKGLSEFLIASAKDFPNLLSEVISIAADEPDARNVKLGIALQISVLSAILKLTVEEAGGMGNLFAQLRVLGANVVAAQAELQNGKPLFSNNSTGGGEKTSTS